VYPSRLRNVVERLRQLTTDKQPYRCHECAWRKWRDLQVHAEGAEVVHPEDLRVGRAPEAISTRELERLDSSAPRT
jgi:hypothetical protein